MLWLHRVIRNDKPSFFSRTGSYVISKVPITLRANNHTLSGGLMTELEDFYCRLSSLVVCWLHRPQAPVRHCLLVSLLPVVFEFIHQHRVRSENGRPFHFALFIVPGYFNILRARIPPPISGPCDQHECIGFASFYPVSYLEIALTTWTCSCGAPGCFQSCIINYSSQDLEASKLPG